MNNAKKHTLEYLYKRGFPVRINTCMLLIILIGTPALLFAQIPAAPSKGDTSFISQMGEALASKIKFSGELGSQGELYGVSGRAAQRPGKTGIVYFRPTVSIFDKFTFSLDLYISTEGKASEFNKNIPRDLNSFGIVPEWSWGRIYYGDFTMQISQFTLSDVKIKGYGIDLFPGIFKFMSFSGKSQKAIAADPQSSLYERTIYGGKIGLGDDGGDHLHLNFLRAYDNPKSLDRSIFLKVDSSAVTGGGMRYDTSWAGISPQENLISEVSWSLGLFKNKFRTKNHLALSIYTADLYAPAIDNEDIPKDLIKYFTPRTTTSGDFALVNENTLNLGSFNMRTGYTLIGPGYTSLGLGSLMNDKQVISGGMGLALFEGKFMIQTSLQTQKDNTANQKLYTTTRDNYSVMVSTRFGENLTLTLLNNGNTMSNTAKNDTLKLNMVAGGYTVSASYLLEAFKVKHTIDGGITVQNFESKNAIRGDNKVAAQTINAGFSTNYTEQLSSSIMATFTGVDTKVAALSTTSKTNSFTGSINYKLMKNKWQNTLSYSNVNSESSTTGVLVLRSTYQLFENSSISLQSRSTTYKRKGAVQIKYSESGTNIDWVYRF